MVNKAISAAREENGAERSVKKAKVIKRKETIKRELEERMEGRKEEREMGRKMRNSMH